MQEITPHAAVFNRDIRAQESALPHFLPGAFGDNPVFFPLITERRYFFLQENPQALTFFVRALEALGLRSAPL
jgi:hypothetical protein